MAPFRSHQLPTLFQDFTHQKSTSKTSEVTLIIFQCLAWWDWVEIYTPRKPTNSSPKKKSDDVHFNREIHRLQLPTSQGVSPSWKSPISKAGFGSILCGEHSWVVYERPKPMKNKGLSFGHQKNRLFTGLGGPWYTSNSNKNNSKSLFHLKWIDCVVWIYPPTE